MSSPAKAVHFGYKIQQSIFDVVLQKGAKHFRVKLKAKYDKLAQSKYRDVR